MTDKPQIDQAIAQLEKHFLLAVPDNQFFYPFRSLANFSGFDSETVKWLCRRLASKGLMEYRQGLWCLENDWPAGAGYGLTRAGSLRLKELRQAGLVIFDEAASIPETSWNACQVTADKPLCDWCDPQGVCSECNGGKHVTYGVDFQDLETRDCDSCGGSGKCLYCPDGAPVND